MKAFIVNSSRSKDPSTTSTTWIWQAASIKELFSAKPTALSDCFHLGLPGYQGSEEENATLKSYLDTFKELAIAARPVLHTSFDKTIREGRTK